MQDLLGRLVEGGITEFGRMANEMGYGLPAEEPVMTMEFPTAGASASAPDAAFVLSHIVPMEASATAEAPAASLIRYAVIDFPTTGATASAEADIWMTPSIDWGDAGATASCDPAIMRVDPAAPTYPIALQLYSTETQLPITTLYEFESLSYSRGKNEAGRVSITFPAGHPANNAIRDIYTAEPHGVYGILYRRGQPWAGVVLAETDITSSPVSWSFMTFEALLRIHETPWNWYGLEGMTIAQALTTLAETGRRSHHISSYEGLSAATLVDAEVKTWAQLSGEDVEGGAYNQPIIVLAKDGTQYKSSGSATFAFDFIDQLPLERIRWKCALGEYVHISYQYRTSADGTTWTEWTTSVEVQDVEYAESHGVAAAGTCRYLEVKFLLSTEDTTTEGPSEEPVGTSPVLFGVEAITTYATGLSAYSIDVPDVEGKPHLADALKAGFNFSHENHLAALASICDDYEYCFKIDHLKHLYVWSPAASSPIIVKKGETCQPQTINYRSIEGIENSLTCYGAGEGLGRLSTLMEDDASILLYGRRPGTFEDSKLTSLASLQSKGQEELDKRAWPVLEAKIEAFYEKGRGVLDATVHDYVLYIDPEAFTGTDDLGQKIFEVVSEQRDFSKDGERVTLGLDSDLDNMFTRQAKQNVKRNYKHGKAVGQVPFDVRAIGAFASVQVLWHGVAQEYIVENSADGLSGWKVLTRTGDTRYVHTQLATGATQYYRVRAVYDGLISGPSLVVSATTTAISPDDLDTVAPATPTGLEAATGTTQTTAGNIVIFNLLSWAEGEETDLAFYELRRSEDNGLSWVAAAVVPAGDSRFVDTAGLKEATTYLYQIRAMDKVGNRSAWSASVSVLTAKDATAPSFLDTAPSVTAGFKRIVPRWHEAQAADISHYLLQRQTADAEWDNDTSKWKVPASPVAGDWADITASAIRALQYHDTDVLFNTCYRYRVAAVDTSGNTSGWTLPSAWAVPSQVDTADAAFRFITAEMYGEIRNVLPYTFEKDVDGTHPVEVPFYIPSETTQIVSIKLSASGEKFRANSKSASAGGAHSHDVAIPDHSHLIGTTLVTEGEVQTGLAGGHTHGSGFTGDESSHKHSLSVSGSTDSVSDHNHSYYDIGWTDTDGDPSHDHGFTVSGTTGSDGGHSHSFSDNGTSGAGSSHKHSIGTDGAHSHDSSYVVPMSTTDEGGGIIKSSSESDAHSHGLVYGIYEAGTPNGVTLYVDNGAGYGTGIALATAPDAATPYALATELDITAHIAGSGWKRLKLTSSRLGTIALQLICKVDLTA